MYNCKKCPLEEKWIACSYEENNIHINQKVRYKSSKEEFEIIGLMSEEELKETRWSLEKRVHVLYRPKNIPNVSFKGWVPVDFLEFKSDRKFKLVEILDNE